QAKTRAQRPYFRPRRPNFPQQSRQPERASTRKIGIVQRADSLSNGAVEAPNQIDLIFPHYQTVVRKRALEKMLVLRVISGKQRHGAQQLIIMEQPASGCRPWITPRVGKDRGADGRSWPASWPRLRRVRLCRRALC